MCKELEEMFNKVEFYINEINLALGSLINDMVFFEHINNRKVIRQSYELSFLYLVSYLYGLYFERSRINSNYIIDKMVVFEGDSLLAKQHLEDIHNLRTFFFHSLGDSTDDKKIMRNCSMWFYEKCMTMYPETEEQWELGVSVLLSNTLKVLLDIKECILSISVDEDCEYIIEEWIIKKERDFPDHVLITLTEEIINRYELKIDAYKFIKTNSNIIRDKLSTIAFDKMEEVESVLKKWIEHIIFTTDNLPCPVTGEDIIMHFKVTGRDLGNLKNKAIELFKEDIYLHKDQLISILKEEFQDLSRLNPPLD